MMRLFLVACLFLVGCTITTGPQLKCEGGVLYVKDNGAWVQAKMYENNKCLPIEEVPK